MEYTEQQKFLRSGRVWGMSLVLVWFGAVLACIKSSKTVNFALLGLYAALASALAVFIYYTPDYLHLTVDPGKRPRWALKIRWAGIFGGPFFIGVFGCVFLSGVVW